MNHLGQILTNNSYITTLLTDFGIYSSVGSIVLVPAGYPGAGNMIIASYNGGILYHVPFTIDASGQYILSNILSEVSVYETADGPEGIAYIPTGSAGFPNPSLVISSYGSGKVVAYEVGEYGLPIPSTAREMVTGLTGAEGALIDPVTGDFLFSTFGGGDKVIRITGFVAPSAIGEKPGTTHSDLPVYPNPTTGLISTEISDHTAGGSFELLNSTGETIMTREIYGKGQYEFDLTGKPSGIYALWMRNGEKVVSTIIVKK